jgi:electron transfer flavoprotein alpha subunit
MTKNRDIWVFGDYRNYFQNRVTLQILARATLLADYTGGDVCAVVFGHNTDEYVREYIAHGAQKVYVIDDPTFASYQIDAFCHCLVKLVEQ